jgi:hypothetical protein
MTAAPVPARGQPSPELAGGSATEGGTPKPSLLIGLNNNMLMPEAHRQVRGWQTETRLGSTQP